MLQAQSGISGSGGPLQVDVAPVSIPFDPSQSGAVNASNNSINTGPVAGLETGVELTYNDEGNAAVGGLISSATYYVNVHSNGAIELYNNAADATAGNGNFIDLSTSGGGSQQEFTFGSAQSVTFNPTGVALRLYTDATDAMAGGATNLVTLASLGGGAQNRLIATNTGLVIFGAGASGADQKLVIGGTVNSTAFNPTGTTIQREPIVNTTVNSSSNPLGSTIYVGLLSGLQTGDAVTYNAGAENATINPLVSGGAYYVNVQNNGAILLYASEAEALAGGAAGLQSLTSTGSGTAQTLSFNPSVHFNPNAPSVINPATNSIFLPPGNGLVTGHEVQYDTEGNAASFGLTNGQTYYVNVQSDGAVALYATLADATAGGSAGLQSLSATTGAGVDQKFIVFSTADKVTFNPTGTTNLIYTPSQQQIEALTAGIKKWTPNELLYGIGQGLLTNSVTDTVVNVQTTPDIAGAHVTLLTGGSVGQNSGTLEIPVVPGETYSTQDLLALATAERTDMQFLGASPTNATVDFSGNAITPISDGCSRNWLTDGFAVGDYISIEGTTQNSTSGGSLDQITSPTPTVMTLSTPLATENNAQITIAAVVSNPVFQALPLTGETTAGSESVNVNFVANGFDDNTGVATPGEIVRDDGGSWIADGFQVGTLVQLTGPASSNNSTGAGLAYTITAITGGSGIEFNPTASGVVNTTLNTIFVGGNTGLVTCDEITYNDQGNTAIGGLTNNAHYYVYVEGDGGFELYDTAAHAAARGSGPGSGLETLSLTASGYDGEQSFAINSAINAKSTLVLSNGDVIFTEGTAASPESISIGRGQSPAIKDIQVEQVTPVWVNAAAQFDITAGTSVFIDSQDNVQINQVVAGETASYQGNIRIYTIGAGVSITNDSSNGAPNLEGQNLILESGSGGIGGRGDSSPITIDLVDQGTLTARAQNDVSINAFSGSLTGDNLGNMYLASVYSSSGNACLTADGVDTGCVQQYLDRHVRRRQHHGGGAKPGYSEQKRDIGRRYQYHREQRWRRRRQYRRRSRYADGRPAGVAGARQHHLDGREQHHVNGPTTGAPVGALLQAGAKISVTTPAKDGSKGNVITVAGELQAPTIQIAGGPSDSVIQVTTGLLDAVFPWTTFSWPFANPPAGLTALPFSASPRLHCQLSNPDHAAGPADGSDTLAINGVTGSDTFLLRTNSVALLQYSNGQLQQTYERINYNTSINVLDVNGLEPDNYVYSDSARTVGQVFADSLRLLVTRTMRRRASPRKAILQHCRRRDDACHRGEPQRRQRADQQFGIERRCEL